MARTQDEDALACSVRTRTKQAESLAVETPTYLRRGALSVLGSPIMLEEVVHTGNDGVVLIIHVQPGARRIGVVGIHGDALKVAVSAAAREGGANRAVVELLGSLLGVPTRKVTIISGARGRRKRVLIEGVTRSRVVEQLLSALGK